MSAGNLFINGVNVRDWPLFTLRQQVASVPQTAVLFTGTIREKLTMGQNQMQLMKTVGKH